MLCVHGNYKYCFFQRGYRLWMSESDVYRRQILTSKVDPRAERVNPKLPYFCTGCRSLSFRCPNKECISRAYICDGFEDCGCRGKGCEEMDCGGIGWSEYCNNGGNLKKCSALGEKGL